MTKPVLSIPDMPFKYSKSADIRRFAVRLATKKWLDIWLYDECEPHTYTVYLDTVRRSNGGHNIDVWYSLELLEAQCLVYKLVEEHGDVSFKNA